MAQGQLIAIEGIDGSGKGTQSALLRDTLLHAGYRAQLISFPRYTSTFFGARVGEFLNGDFGELQDVHPFLASLLYAGDRLESKQLLLDSLATSDFVILDRYVASSLAHQSVRAADPGKLTQWVEAVEFGIHGLPRPDLTILLDIEPKNAQILIEKKGKRSYTDKPKDIQEADAQYLQKVRNAYLYLSDRGDWDVIRVDREDSILPVTTVHQEIRGLFDGYF